MRRKYSKIEWQSREPISECNSHIIFHARTTAANLKAVLEAALSSSSRYWSERSGSAVLEAHEGPQQRTSRLCWRRHSAAAVATGARGADLYLYRAHCFLCMGCCIHRKLATDETTGIQVQSRQQLHVRPMVQPVRRRRRRQRRLNV
ncbi:unnamed protein product [Toxocara canis]|uniref:Uncharacterized protein n=1 Tax=Toxocara canis TaxID=6265 RepID=A0A183V8F4_TOXCA|nr:unnamed protein product [Toxocara canis]